MILTDQITEIGGPKVVAEILNRTGRSTEKAVLEGMDSQDPELAEEVRNQLFIFDDIANLTDRDGCKGHYLKLSVAADGKTYTMSNPRNGEDVTYKTKLK